MLMYSSRSAMLTLPTATPRHSTFFSWYLTLERISLAWGWVEGVWGGGVQGAQGALQGVALQGCHARY